MNVGQIMVSLSILHYGHTDCLNVDELEHSVQTKGVSISCADAARLLNDQSPKHA